MERDTAEIIVKVYAVLAWLGALMALFGAFVFLGASVLGGASTALLGVRPEEFAAGGLLAGLGIVFGILFIAIAIFDAIVGWGLWTRKPWARVATIVMSILSLFSFPIGTLIGALGIWLFGFEETVKSLFGTPVATAVKSRPAKRVVKKRK